VQQYKVELLAPAWKDLDAISDFHLEAVGPKSARNITDKIFDALARLELFPLSCPLAPHPMLANQGFRILVYGSYICLYKLQGNIVYVHHIVAAASNYPSLFPLTNTE